MELIKKPIRSYRTIDISEPEEMFEHSIIVPDVKPDVKNILLADAEGFVTSIEKTGRMVEVTGEIQYKILYISDAPEQKVESITARYPWSFSLQKPKNEGEIGAFAKCRCQHTDVNIVNGRKIVCRTVTSLICRFYEISSEEIGREILGENVFLKTTPVNIVTLKDNVDINVRVADTLVLPPGSPAIKEIMFSRVNLSHADLNNGDEEWYLEAKGTLFMLYRSDTMDESIESVVLEFPVNASAGVQGSENAKILATNALRDWEVKLMEDDDGLFTKLSVELNVEIDAQSMVSDQQVIIEDAYSCDYRMDLNKVSKKVITDEREFCDDHLLTQRISLDVMDDPLSEVLMVCANERNIASMMGDNINVQGTIGLNVLFLTQNNEYHGSMLDLPFTHGFSFPEVGNWQITQTWFTIEEVSFDIAGSEGIELSIKLKINIRASKLDEIVCADSLNVVKEECESNAPFIIYFAQPNDTLWDIAKNYRIPISKLCEDNAIDGEARIDVGKRLFIMN